MLVEFSFKGYIGAFPGSALGLSEAAGISRRPLRQETLGLAKLKQVLCSEMLYQGPGEKRWQHFMLTHV